MPNSPINTDFWDRYIALDRAREEIERARREELARQQLESRARIQRMAQAQSDLVQAAERDRSRQVLPYHNDLASLYDFAWLDGDDVVRSGQIPAAPRVQAAPQPQPVQPEEPQCRCEACTSVEGVYVQDCVATPPVAIRPGASLSETLRAVRTALDTGGFDGEGGERNDR